jgi:predicted PilT family ATPase
VMPLKDLMSGPWSKEQQKSWLRLFAEQWLREILQRRLDCRFALIVDSMNSITIYVPEQSKWWIIGKWGSNIMKLEKELGVSISLRSFEDIPTEPVRVTFQWKKQDAVLISLWTQSANKSVRLLLWGEVIESMNADAQGDICIDRRYLVKLAGRWVKKIV